MTKKRRAELRKQVEESGWTQKPVAEAVVVELLDALDAAERKLEAARLGFARVVSIANDTMPECVLAKKPLPKPKLSPDGKIPSATPSGPPPPYDLILKVWNECPNVKPASALTSSRRRKLATRWRDSGFAAQWRMAIQRLHQAHIDWDWTPTLDWFLKNDTNYIKALEGSYDGKPKPQSPDDLCRVRRGDG